MTDMSGQALTPLGAQLVKIQAGLRRECRRFRASFFKHLEDFPLRVGKNRDYLRLSGSEIARGLFARIFDVKVSRWRRVGNIRGEGLYGQLHAGYMPCPLVFN